MKPEAVKPFLLKPLHLRARLLWRKQGMSWFTTYSYSWEIKRKSASMVIVSQKAEGIVVMRNLTSDSPTKNTKEKISHLLHTAFLFDHRIQLLVPKWHTANFILRIYTVDFINPSAWGHLNPSSYCDVGRLFYGVFKLWSKLQRKKWRNNF